MVLNIFKSEINVSLTFFFLLFSMKLNRMPCHDYFFALKNVTFCGFHPTEYQYFGFITKHPQEERFACHVFQGSGSTRHVAEAIGYQTRYLKPFYYPDNSILSDRQDFFSLETAKN